MGYTVLYIAFGVVALWLLGEVLLQYKARLRWRLLAFVGFLGVVAGVYLPSVIVIAVGAACFGTGQTFVTFSYRKGFVAGWALRRPRHDTDGEMSGPGAGRRDSEAAEPDEQQPSQAGARYPEDTEEVTAFGVGYDHYDQMPTADGGPSTQVFEPTPMHEDSGEFAAYGERSPYAQGSYDNGGYQGYGSQGYDGWGGGHQQPAAGYDGSYGWGGQGQGQNQGGYDPNGTQHGYSDPYGGYPQQYGQGHHQQGQYEDHGQYQNHGQQEQQDQGQHGQYGYDAAHSGGWATGEPQAYIPQQQEDPHEEQRAPYGADPYDPYRYQG
jgi:hypothetical protein